ncbi:hypothetical protein V565_069950 [Rhizoctonia solani 123E]|uniref:Amidase domain-containing protein n=1 Tax=Rhizoctonia solani 123E TaxID=1423351 RepID=A0A074SLL9_9AGAM|nr:hypothetical protein V565_069950 [Rhizoctonia solani 123E]
MHGIPILVKDSIGTLASEGMNTTAGLYICAPWFGYTQRGDCRCQVETDGSDHFGKRETRAFGLQYILHGVIVASNQFGSRASC